MRHVLVAYKFRPKVGHVFLDAAVKFAAEASTGVGGTQQDGCWDRFAESCNAMVYRADPDAEDLRIAFHTAAFDRSVIDGGASISSLLALITGAVCEAPEFDLCEVRDVFLPVGFTRLFPGPAMGIVQLWRCLRGPDSPGAHGLLLGHALRPRLGLLAQDCGRACADAWRAGFDYVHCGALHGNQPYCPMQSLLPEVVAAMRDCIEETGQQKLFAVNVTADDPEESFARVEYALREFGPLAPNCALLVDASQSGLSLAAALRRRFPGQFLHYVARCSAGRLEARGYSELVHAKVTRLLGASVVEAHASQWNFRATAAQHFDQGGGGGSAAMLLEDCAEGPRFRQEWQGMCPAAPAVSGQVTALQLPHMLQRLGHSNVMFFPSDGTPSPAACRELEQLWARWRSAPEDTNRCTLAEFVVAGAGRSGELRRLFFDSPVDADILYPSWRAADWAACPAERTPPAASPPPPPPLAATPAPGVSGVSEGRRSAPAWSDDPRESAARQLPQEKQRDAAAGLSQQPGEDDGPLAELEARMSELKRESSRLRLELQKAQAEERGGAAGGPGGPGSHSAATAARARRSAGRSASKADGASSAGDGSGVVETQAVADRQERLAELRRQRLADRRAKLARYLQEELAKAETGAQEAPDSPPLLRSD